MAAKDLRAELEPHGTFAIWRGSFRCGSVYHQSHFADPSLNGWYAHLIYEGRESRQRRPSQTPQNAALKMWGSRGRAAIDAALIQAGAA